MKPALACIVEGHSEVESLPILLRRVMKEMGRDDVFIPRPLRAHRYQIVREGELEKKIRQVIMTRREVGGVLILLDADYDCPARLAPELLERAKKATTLPISVVLADTEFEAWFLGSIESLRGIRGIRDDAEHPKEAEDIHKAKEWLSRLMRRRRYVSVDDQPALAEVMDFRLAQERCPSFDKFLRDVKRLIEEIAGRSSG